MNNKIGIITVFYKSDGVLPAFIECLNNQTTQNFEVFFIENDPANTFSENYVKENCKFQYGYKKNTANLGIAAANNQGIDYFAEKGDTDFILFFNNDIEIANDFLEKHLLLFEKYPFIDALAPKMFYYNTDGKIWYAGGTLSYLKGGCRHFGHNKPDKLVGKEIYKVSYAPTCSVMIKTPWLLNSGVRMWENLFVYHDDVVFAQELRKKNVQFYYTPDIHLQHKIGNSSGGSKSDFSRYYRTRNWAYVARVDRSICLTYIPFMMLINLIKGNKIENKAIKDSFKMSAAV